jgi:hypothetical protein
MAQLVTPMANRIMKIVVMVVGSMPESFGSSVYSASPG